MSNEGSSSIDSSLGIVARLLKRVNADMALLDGHIEKKQKFAENKPESFDALTDAIYEAFLDDGEIPLSKPYLRNQMLSFYERQVNNDRHRQILLMQEVNTLIGNNLILSDHLNKLIAKVVSATQNDTNENTDWWTAKFQNENKRIAEDLATNNKNIAKKNKEITHLSRVILLNEKKIEDQMKTTTSQILGNDSEEAKQFKTSRMFDYLVLLSGLIMRHCNKMSVSYTRENFSNAVKCAISVVSKKGHKRELKTILLKLYNINFTNGGTSCEETRNRIYEFYQVAGLSPPNIRVKSALKNSQKDS